MTRRTSCTDVKITTVGRPKTTYFIDVIPLKFLTLETYGMCRYDDYEP